MAEHMSKKSYFIDITYESIHVVDMFLNLLNLMAVAGYTSGESRGKFMGIPLSIPFSPTSRRATCGSL